MVAKSTKQRVIKRLQWTSQVEGINCVMFLGILAFLNFSYTVSNLYILSYGLLFMCFILFQGTYYWWKKLSVLKGKSINQTKVLRRFQSFKTMNEIGIVLIPVVIVLQWYASGRQLNGSNFLIWGFLANGFAILEHINYYHKQIMLDNEHDVNFVLRNRKIKEASLAKDLREQKI
ncbi:MAG: hypothetical protein WD361_04475 [Gracilimonas sp.]